ncbi:hypothetical protein GCM10029992_44670 [Glycomyces albus]
MRPFQRYGQTFIPLTAKLGGLQAYKQIRPADPDPDKRPDQRVHEGYEWLYILSGRLRLLLGPHDLILGPGEAAEFDTRVPHAFTNPGPGPAEFLTIFGPQGRRCTSKPNPRTDERTEPGPQPPPRSEPSSASPASAATARARHRSTSPRRPSASATDDANLASRTRTSPRSDSNLPA